MVLISPSLWVSIFSLLLNIVCFCQLVPNNAWCRFFKGLSAATVPFIWMKGNVSRNLSILLIAELKTGKNQAWIYCAPFSLSHLSALCNYMEAAGGFRDRMCLLYQATHLCPCNYMPEAFSTMCHLQY